MFLDLPWLQKRREIPDGNFVFAVEHRLLFGWCCLEPHAGIRLDVSCQEFWSLWGDGVAVKSEPHSLHQREPCSLLL